MFPTATLPPTVDPEFPVLMQSNGGEIDARSILACVPTRARAMGLGRRAYAPGSSLDSPWFGDIHDLAGAFDAALAGIGNKFTATVGVGPQPAWSSALGTAAAEVRALKAGWDGPGSLPVANHALFKAETLVRDALDGRHYATAPYLVPGGDGSIQIEWHRRHGEIELSIDRNGETYVWGRIHQSGHEFEGEGAAALDLFARWAPWISTEPHDVGHAPVAHEEIVLDAA